VVHQLLPELIAYKDALHHYYCNTAQVLASKHQRLATAAHTLAAVLICQL
jgi:hypothetical protein